MTPASANSTPSGRAGDREAYGPLEIEREVKDDGRSLILYTNRKGVDTKLYARREEADAKGADAIPTTGPERAGA